MKRIIKLFTICCLLAIRPLAQAQELIPDSLGKRIPVNGQFFITIHNGDTAIWHQKGVPYGIERVAKYKNLLKYQTKLTFDSTPTSASINPVTSGGVFTALGLKLPTTITATGDIIYSSSGTTASRLGIGSTNQVLTVVSGLPSWQTPSASNLSVYTAFGLAASTAPGSNFYFFGDSITLGIGASVTANCWPSLLASAFGVTSNNYGVGSTIASMMDQSLIPTYAGGYLFIAYGTNDASTNVPDATFSAASQSNLNACFSKGWPANHIMLITTFGASSTSGAGIDAKLRAKNAVIQTLAATNGTLITDVYDGMLNNLPVAQIANFNSPPHPNDLGYKLIEQLIIFKTGAIKAAASTQALPIGIDSTGRTIGIINSMKNGFMLNQTYLGGGLTQTGATVPTTYNPKIDNLWTVGSKEIAALSLAGVINYQTLSDNTGNMIFSSNYSGGNFIFKTSGGTNNSSVNSLQLFATGQLGIAQNSPFGSYNSFNTSGFAGTWIPLDNSGNTIFGNSFSTGVYKWNVSNGTNGAVVTAYQMDASGNVIYQLGGTYTAVPSSRLTINSTTQGVLLPRMTSTQRDAMLSPVEGVEIYNLTTHTKNFYNGSGWRQITDTAAP